MFVYGASCVVLVISKKMIASLGKVFISKVLMITFYILNRQLSIKVNAYMFVLNQVIYHLTSWVEGFVNWKDVLFAVR